ncbi:hypothetical protein TYRP_021401 [Tyrophagus putrescentiae]|nr:hypothetical protein TYRP_021401 [Tyrophagus putrescentiae]
MSTTPLFRAYHNDSHHDEAGAGGDVHRRKDGQQEDGFQGDVVLIRGKDFEGTRRRLPLLAALTNENINVFAETLHEEDDVLQTGRVGDASMLVVTKRFTGGGLLSAPFNACTCGWWALVTAGPSGPVWCSSSRLRVVGESHSLATYCRKWISRSTSYSLQMSRISARKEIACYAKRRNKTRNGYGH